jgi:hypothetical protein
MYEYSPGELGEIWPRRRDAFNSFGFGASVSVDDPTTGRHCEANERRIHPIVVPPSSELVNIDPRFQANRVPPTRPQPKLQRATYDAYVALKNAAEGDGIPPRLLTIVSGYRTLTEQRRKWEEAKVKYGTEERARVWVAPPGGSAHNTGRAIDFWLGLDLDSRNVPALRSLPAYRWLVCNAGRFGFTPYAREPWHWEFTPPGSPQPGPARNLPGQGPRRPPLPPQPMGSSPSGPVPAPPGPHPRRRPAPQHHFPPEVVAAAIASRSRWGVPASVTLAQWALESAWGTRMPAHSNNPFGIKAAAGQPFVEATTREVLHGQPVTVRARFRRFDSMADAFDQHGRLLATHGPYAHAMTLRDQPDAFADALTGVYATDPHYGAVLKSIMRAHNLYQYDSQEVAFRRSSARTRGFVSSNKEDLVV